MMDNVQYTYIICRYKYTYEVKYGTFIRKVFNDEYVHFTLYNII